MARNSHDLFEVLGAHLGRRGKQQSSGQKPSGQKAYGQSAASRRGRSRDSDGEISSPIDIGRRLITWFGGLFGKQAKGRRRSTAAVGGRGTISSSLTFGGSFVAAAIVVSLAAGFMAGRWSDASAAATSLRADPKGQVPGPLNAQSLAVTLTAEQEVEQLSRHAYRVFLYSGADRAKASRLTNWLISQGVLGARLRRMRKDSSLVWVVVCYVPAPEDHGVFDILKKLDAPSFEPRLARVLAKLNPKPDPIGA